MSAYMGVYAEIVAAADALQKRNPKLSETECWTRSRRGYLSAQALKHPEGQTKYAYTRGMAQVDALAFWTDAAELGFIKLGRNDRGTNVFGWRSTVEEVSAP